jgi:hypothetical protein
MTRSSFRELLTIQGVAMRQEFEYQLDQSQDWVGNAEIRVFPIPGAKDRRYCVFLTLPVDAKYTLRAGDRIKMSFDPYTKNRFDDVSANMVEPNILGAIGDIALYFTRQRDKTAKRFKDFSHDFKFTETESFQRMDDARIAVRF